MSEDEVLTAALRISQLHDFSLHHVLSILQSFYTSRQNSKKQTSV
jgi:hypothetical protein